MDLFERELRQRLVAAADRAPALPQRNLSLDRDMNLDRATQPKPPHRRSPRLLATAAAIAVLAGGAGWWSFARSPEQEAGSALCANVLDVGGVRYVGLGGELRIPREGKYVASGVIPRCGGSAARSVPVYAFAGVTPDVAITAEGGVWAAEKLARLPAELAELRKPVPCAVVGVGQVAGVWIEVRGSEPTANYQVPVPYTAVVEADTGDGLPLSLYERVAVSMRVTDQTLGHDDPALMRDTLGSGRRVQAQVRCVGDRFIAVSLRRD
jgi:hypothetical protein